MKKNTKTGTKTEFETEVIVEFPGKIEIKLAQINDLKYYELFQWLVVLMLPIAVGFWTAYFSGSRKAELFWSGVIFTIISLLFTYLAYRHRKKIFQTSIKKVAFLDSFKNKQ